MSDKKAKNRPESSRHGTGSDGASDELANADPTLAHIPRVLIVEDTVELADLLQATIERMHMLAFTETHGLRALELYNEVHPDVVLLDIALPDMTGWKVLDAMKESKAIFRSLRIVVMTAYGDPANRLMGKLQGVDKYLIKPFTPAEVISVIQEVLAKDPNISDEFDETAQKRD